MNLHSKSLFVTPPICVYKSSAGEIIKTGAVGFAQTIRLDPHSPQKENLVLSEVFEVRKSKRLKTVRFQRHLPLTIQFYISCRITGIPPLQSNFSGLSSALKDDTNEPKKRKETRTKPTKMARKKSTLRMTRTTTDKLPIADTDLR